MTNYEEFALNTRAPCHGDDTLVRLNPDQKAVISKNTAKVVGAVRFVAEMASKDTLHVSTRANGLSVAFSALEAAAKSAGYDSDREDDLKATRSILRAANERIRSLEGQLAGSISGESLAQAVRKAVDSIYGDWKEAGFSFASDIHMGSRYLSAKLHCDADGGESSISETPQSDKVTAIEKQRALVGAGIKFSGNGSGREDRHVLDTDDNKAQIAEVILGIWPQARIVEWSSHYSTFGSLSGFTLRSVTVLIPVESLVR